MQIAQVGLPCRRLLSKQLLEFVSVSASLSLVFFSGSISTRMDQRSLLRALTKRNKSCAGSFVLAVQVALHNQSSHSRAQRQLCFHKDSKRQEAQDRHRKQVGPAAAEQWPQAAAWCASQHSRQSQAADCETPGTHCRDLCVYVSYPLFTLHTSAV